MKWGCTVTDEHQTDALRDAMHYAAALLYQIILTTRKTNYFIFNYFPSVAIAPPYRHKHRFPVPFPSGTDRRTSDRCVTLSAVDAASVRVLIVAVTRSFRVGFYRARLCIRGTSHGPVSVCVCVRLCLSQVGVLLKRLNVGSHKQHHTIPRRSPRNSTGVTPYEGAERRWGGQNRRLSTNIRLISKTVQDRHIVSIKVE